MPLQGRQREWAITYVLQELYVKKENQVTLSDHRKNLKKKFRSAAFDQKIREYHAQIWPGVPAIFQHLDDVTKDLADKVSI